MTVSDESSARNTDVRNMNLWISAESKRSESCVHLVAHQGCQRRVTVTPRLSEDTFAKLLPRTHRFMGMLRVLEGSTLVRIQVRCMQSIDAKNSARQIETMPEFRHQNECIALIAVA